MKKTVQIRIKTHASKKKAKKNRTSKHKAIANLAEKKIRLKPSDIIFLEKFKFFKQAIAAMKI